MGGPDVLVISSLAKGFGVPVAVLSGSREAVRGFEMKSETRVHASPPSIAVIHAVEHALAVNCERGDTLRLRLARLACRFRERLAEAGLAVAGHLFPVQTLLPIPNFPAATLHKCLLRRGVRTVLHHGHHGSRISFILTVRHSSADIERAAEALFRSTA